MSTALTYQEPHFFVAGALALAVHLAFFTPLYFAAKWQAQQPEAFMVDMWDSLPDMEVTPVQEPTPAPPTTAEPVPPPKVVEPVLPPVQADIEVRDKNAKKKKQAEEKQKAAVSARAKQEKERRELDEYVARRVQSEQERIRAEVDTATRVQIERYQDLIRNKIRRNIVPPPDVSESAKAEFKVTLLPSGDVMAVELLKSSGNAAYDNAAERAIYKAQPLPMPTENGLQKMFRELRLTIRP